MIRTKMYMFVIKMSKSIQILPFFLDPEARKSQLLLNSIIEMSYQIALKYLRYHQRKVSGLLNREEISIQELAVDSIAELFIKDNNGNFSTLLTSFNNWQPAIKTEEEANFFLNKIVSVRVEQNIFKILKEEDPFFSKLLDSINHLIKQNGFYKIHFLGKTYITETQQEAFSKSFITLEEFNNLPSELFHQKKFLLKSLLNHLRLETEFNAAIPLNDLIYKLKHINFSDYLFIDSENVLSQKFELSDIINTGFSVVSEKLSNYLVKGKLNEEEILAIKEALKEMISDLSNGGVSPGLYGYLKPHIHNLSEDDYWIKYHNILEYMLKVMKNKIAEILQEKN